MVIKNRILEWLPSYELPKNSIEFEALKQTIYELDIYQERNRVGNNMYSSALNHYGNYLRIFDHKDRNIFKENEEFTSEAYIKQTSMKSDMDRTELNKEKSGCLVKGIEAIIGSMTPKERTQPEIMNGSRRQRIAKGSGQTIQEVNKLLKQFEDTRKMMRMMGDKNQMAKLMKNMPGGMPKM